jgi:HSP20 family molecular chaperone IbpA
MMNTLTDRIIPCFNEPIASRDGFQTPRFVASERLETLKFDVFVPGVSPDDVSLAMDNGELVVTAKRTHMVRQNWHAANIEAVQGDYQLRIKLDQATQTDSICAIHCDGILTIHLQKNLPLLPMAQMMVA